MIRVDPKPEYPLFDVEVRRPGAAFLAICPTPTSKQFKEKGFWSKAARELQAAYSGICAYTAMYLPQQGSVDHFLPKTLRPDLAYEWSNFRLASARVNSSKGHTTHVLDPFLVGDDWFQMDLPGCLLKANPALSRDIRVQINQTINTLGLNRDDNYVQDRADILMEYAREHVTVAFLERRYPFIAKEVARHGLDQAALRNVFRL